jgi:hypothetical protein
MLITLHKCYSHEIAFMSINRHLFKLMSEVLHTDAYLLYTITTFIDVNYVATIIFCIRRFIAIKLHTYVVCTTHALSP